MSVRVEWFKQDQMKRGQQHGGKHRGMQTHTRANTKSAEGSGYNGERRLRQQDGGKHRDMETHTRAKDKKTDKIRQDADKATGR